MKQTIRFLGIGLDYLVWKRLVQHLTVLFPQTHFDISSDLARYKWSKFKETSLRKMTEFKPDFIFTSLAPFKTIEEMEAFFQLYQPADLIDYPSLVLIEKNPHRFIEKYLKTHPFSEFSFRQYPRLKISRPEWFASGDISEPLMEIQPLPDLHLVKQQEIFLDRERLVGFAAWNDLSAITWRGNRYKPGEFCRLFEKTYENPIKTKFYKGILLDSGRAYLSPGFFIRDIIEFETDYFPIEHLISYHQIKANGQDVETLKDKITEAAKFRFSIQFNENFFHDKVSVKANTPITVSADSSFVCSVFAQLMVHDGYLQAVSADEASDSADRFLISLHSEPVENTPFTFSIILNEEDFIHDSDPAYSAVRLTELELEDVSDGVVIQKRLSQAGKRLEKLQGQLKVLTSSKAETDKKRYMDMISSNKLEIIKNLLDISEIWDEHSCDISVMKQENVLVLVDEQRQADLIDTQLSFSNRKRFIDTTQSMMDLQSLVALNTGPLEPFLHDGIVICCRTTKAILMRRFQQFETELSQKSYPSLDDAIRNLKADIVACENNKRRLDLLKKASQLKELYNHHADLLLTSIQNYFREAEKAKYTVRSGSNLIVITNDREYGEMVKSALLASFSGLNGIRLTLINPTFTLASQVLPDADDLPDQPESAAAAESGGELPDIADYNAQKLSGYFRSVAAEIGLRDCDVFYLAGDPQIHQVLIEFLRQPGSKYMHTPIVLLASGAFSVDLMKQLVKRGVKVLYQDQFRKDNPEAISHTFRTFFSIH